MTQTTKEFVYSPISDSRVYHYLGDDGEPICNETRLGRQKPYMEDGDVIVPERQLEYADEGELPKERVLCGKCEKGGRKGYQQLIREIKSELSTESNTQSLSKDELKEILERLTVPP